MSRKKKQERFKEVRNSRAHKDFFVDETLEAGIVLDGNEVKSIRQGTVQIGEGFVRIDKGIPILYHAHIAAYAFGSQASHNPYRPRRLLLNKREIRKWEQAIQSGGRTIIPLRMYFKKGLIKLEIGLARTKKQYDKREDMKKAVDIRETQRTVKHHL
ncbi:SsrA-binding protein SmpB [Puniceicoccales bacterium CK1056]|uniref:SsrA-binding protein n=1 Tax=Oceanipulchritudo coccoides TaxID=2706888 RepID=A0A6B2LY56_9BACT|nr:SsrA-binding protein SmpB [Oceanipulchritudo coccoides]NDV61052.1 SsrA-binding protein SmpB [Oceanipulchritudo coccoides]